MILPHNAKVIPSRIRKCAFPDVMNHSEMNIIVRNARTKSSKKRKVGCNEEPGVKIFAKNDCSSRGPSAAAFCSSKVAVDMIL